MKPKQTPEPIDHELHPCVRRDHRTSFCGRIVSMEWAFTGPDHAAAHVAQEGRLIPCPNCQKVLAVKRRFTLTYPTDMLAILCENVAPVYIMQREHPEVPEVGDWHVRAMDGRLVAKGAYRDELLAMLERREVE